MHAKTLRSLVGRFVAPMVVSLSLVSILTGCKDDYIYDDQEPDSLGESIYAYLAGQPDFTYMVRLIDDLGYTETLSRTGSKTLFPANDAAFERFFQSNIYGVHRYEDLTAAQKKAIMNTSMINMAYLSDMLPNVANTSGTDTGGKGLAMRRNTSGTYLDSIQTVATVDVIDTPFWKRFQEKPLFICQSAPMLLQFTPAFASTAEMTSDDFQAIYNRTLSGSGIFIGDTYVTQADIICKNGYIHVVHDVLVPQATMAQIIDRQDDTTIFKSLLDKFCAPYYNETYDKAIHAHYDGSSALRPAIKGMTSEDSVFVKRYFNMVNCTTSPLDQDLSNYGLLYYDPNDPLYSSSSSEQDMGVMFVPSDKAMNDYLDGPEGSYLKTAYGSWDNVPTNIAAAFLKNHQKRSFVNSLPHLWPTLTDESSYPISITQANVVRSIPGNNGIVYVIDKVLPPIDYKSVYGSVLVHNETKVMDWAITDDWNNIGDQNAMRFYMYLRSMENMYNVLVPTDEAFHNYRDPISWARGGSYRQIWDFYYSDRYGYVVADIYATDENGLKTGEPIRTETSKSVIRNRMQDILDMHIVVGDNTGGVMTGYINLGQATSYVTKGGATILVSGQGNQVKMQGGGDVEQGMPMANVEYVDGVPGVFESQNGRTFFIDHILHDPSMNVYDVLASHPEFQTFFELCQGDPRVSAMLENDDEFEEIFSSKMLSSSVGVGQIVNSFNNYRYTILVPTNQAIADAFAADPKLCTWEEIADDINPESQKRKALYLLKFLRYHFVDNAVYVGGLPTGSLSYETAARNSYNRFHKLTIINTGTDVTITDESHNTARVLKTPGSYNCMARDLIVNNTDVAKATEIVSSSRAVIHQIDRALKYVD